MSTPQINRDVFPYFTLSHYSSENRLPSEGFIKIKKIDQNYYLINEDDIIDEYTGNDKSVKIETIEELYEIINSGANVHIEYSENSTITEQFLIDKGQTITLDLLSDTVIDSQGSIGSSSRLFQINDGTLIINGNGATITSSNESYGVFRVEANGKLELNNLVLNNSRGWGLNVKILGGEAILNNVVINSTTGGGIEVTEANLGTSSQTGIATLNNCTFTQSGYQDHCSTCLSVSGGSKLIINSGTYISNDGYSLYVFSSGGQIEVNDGMFQGNKDGICMIAAIDTQTYPQYEGGFVINGGQFTGDASIKVPAYLVINKGTFTFDPTQYVDTSVHTVTESDGKYVVE